jgi:hypothetical protein
MTLQSQEAYLAAPMLDTLIVEENKSNSWNLTQSASMLQNIQLYRPRGYYEKN